MRYLTLVCDYDGTLAKEGRVSQDTLAKLEQVKASGRRLLLVTGRELTDLLYVFPQISIFDRVVAENGALMYTPATREEKLLSAPPSQEFVNVLAARQVQPLSVGKVIVATEHPNENLVLETIRDLGLELQVIFNKGSVMILPTGINKATGLTTALRDMGLSPHNAVGVGDAENDHAFLTLCECSIAVEDAVPMLKDTADFIASHGNGRGVAELIDRLLSHDLQDLDARLTRHHILLGEREDGRDVLVSPYGANILLAGTSGSGKTTVATGFLERLGEAKYQFCIIDPEGDYENFEGAVTIGSAQKEPDIQELLTLLDTPEQNVVVNLLGVKLENRPGFFAELLPRLQELRVRTGRPHWIVIDEAHHLMPTSWDPASSLLPKDLYGILFITVHPDGLAPVVLSSVDIILAKGESPEKVIKGVAEVLQEIPPRMEAVELEPENTLAWFRQQEDGGPFKLRVAPTRSERKRHRRKYAEGEMPPEQSFYFRGPDNKLNLRAQNLALFVQLADGVDEDTWTYHLRNGEYSHWMREVIKDEILASEIAGIEARHDLSAAQSRQLVKDAIEQLYIVPSR